MNYIKPITRPVNNQEIVDWKLKYSQKQRMLDNFIEQQKRNGYTKEAAMEIWVQNFGPVPPTIPDKIYQCEIINSGIKIKATVLKRNNILPNERKYEVVKLNHLYLETFDHSKLSLVDSDGNAVLKANNLTASTDKVEDLAIKSYPLNYEDSGWFSNLHINELLSRLKINIEEYMLPSQDENPSKPVLYINNMDSMETSQFKITDEEFKEKLYNKINEKFLEIESQLK